MPVPLRSLKGVNLNNRPLTAAEQSYASAYSNKFGIPDKKIIAGLPDKGLSILSLGSGDCADLWFLASDNEIYAIDGSPSAIDVATAHGINGQVYNLDNDLPFNDNRFDLIVCKDLLEHIMAPERLLAEISRVLKPTGKLVVSIPNHFYFPFRLKILFGSNLIWKTTIHDHSTVYDEWNYMHIRFFTYKGFMRFLGKYGFTVEKAFWDFGVLAHYSSPDLFYDHIKEKYRGREYTTKAKFYMYGIMPLWRIFNVLFPRKLRHAIVSLSPGLMCAGFYLRCVKK